MNDPFFDTSLLFLKKNNVCIDEEKFKIELYTHPSFPTIWSLTETLLLFNIHIEVIKANWDILLENKDIPILLQLKESSNFLVLVTKITENEIIYIDGNKVKHTENKDKFLNKWDGIIIYLSDIDNNKQKNCNSKKRESKLYSTSFAFCLCAFIGGILYINPLINWMILFLLKIVGSIISYYLVKHSLGKTGDFENKICHLISTTDCNAVLSSSASKLFGKISMSDIGVVYFSGGILVLIGGLLSGYQAQSLNILAIFSLCSIPYTLFSIYYQRFIIKKWCLFCLAVISILWCESFLSLFYLPSNINTILNYRLLIYTLIIFIFVNAIWFFINSILKKYIYAYNNSIDYIHMLKNNKIFQSIWHQQYKYQHLESENEIVIGENSALISITAVLSLHCIPCAEAYKKIYTLINNYPDTYNLKIIFYLHDENEMKIQDYSRMLNFYQIEPNKQFASILYDWYEIRDLKKFIKKNPILNSYDNQYYYNYMEKSLLWCKNNQIKQTPTIFIQERLLPNIYKIEDIIYFTDILKEKRS